jgi:hypothetical protein
MSNPKPCGKRPIRCYRNASARRWPKPPESPHVPAPPHHSVEAPGASGGGATRVGVAGAVGGRFGAAGFLAAAGCVGGTVGRGDSSDALAADDGAALAEGGTARCAGAAPAPGSGVMMLTAGVDAAVGKSALVGRPVAVDGGIIAIGELAGTEFHDGE